MYTRESQEKLGQTATVTHIILFSLHFFSGLWFQPTSQPFQSGWLACAKLKTAIEIKRTIYIHLYPFIMYHMTS